MHKLILFLENINEQVGKLFSWSTTLLVWLLFVLVVMRYGLGIFSQKMNELCTYFFAICFKYAYTSFKLGEASQEPSGLPALYVLKSILFIGFVLLLLQAIASILKSIYILIGKDESLLIPTNKKTHL